MTQKPTDVLDVLVVTGGHPFEEEPFFAVFDALPGVRWEPASAPATGHDVVVFYDMPGLRFTQGEPPVELTEPTQAQRETIERLCAAGTGLVFLHHAVGGWPAWPAYAELIGGRFHYQPAELAGEIYPDSGYRFDVTHTVEVLAPDHPVCAGLGPSFTITDELYCFPVLTDRIVPLMRTTFDTADPANFWSSDLAIRGREQQRRLEPPTGQRPGGVGHERRPQPGHLPPVRGRSGDLRRPVVPPRPRQRDRLGGVR